MLTEVINKREREFKLNLEIYLNDILCYFLLTKHSSMFFSPCYKLRHKYYLSIRLVLDVKSIKFSELIEFYSVALKHDCHGDFKN